MSMQPPAPGYPPSQAYPPPGPPGRMGPPPPPPQMAGPMPVRPVAGTRPTGATVAGVALGGLALLFLVGAIMEFADIVPRGAPFSSITNVRGVFLIVMGLGAAGAAVLAFVNPDFGRVFAAAAAGAGIWEAAGGWREIMLALFDENSGIYPNEFWIRIAPVVLGGFLGILALVMLASPKISDWSVAKRGS
ncbi:hypothetical protein [Phytomonospora endophytica]|uniref:Uncharacterized protein n=1 Tax=Phytomonospora endophytica TaxID=714109 RepID=A0A841FGR2_9ACTN|nr:hypothetical protein [Phytomonospora endophytica]MBB6034183.1 hypothetical protein [Phytomonospora endophytica]GIG66575.1 hypothetical protein Pen01_28700 [Phytomonospora endophytica]